MNRITHFKVNYILPFQYFKNFGAFDYKTQGQKFETQRRQTKENTEFPFDFTGQSPIFTPILKMMIGCGHSIFLKSISTKILMIA